MREDLFNKLRELKETLKLEYGIKGIAIFGSYAKGMESDASDIDIVILDMDEKNGLLIAKAKNFLEGELKVKVDIGLFSSLHPFIKKRIAGELIYV